MPPVYPQWCLASLPRSPAHAPRTGSSDFVPPWHHVPAFLTSPRPGQLQPLLPRQFDSSSGSFPRPRPVVTPPPPFLTISVWGSPSSSASSALTRVFLASPFRSPQRLFAYTTYGIVSPRRHCSRIPRPSTQSPSTVPVVTTFACDCSSPDTCDAASLVYVLARQFLLRPSFT